MRLTKSEREKQKQEAIDHLRSILPAGSTVYTVLMNVSRSGMSRTIKCLVATNEAKETGKLMTHETGKPTVNHWENTKIYDISWCVARALGERMSKNEGGVVVGGCGMDMGFHLVSTLASLLGYSKGETKYQEYTNAYGLNHRWL